MTVKLPHSLAASRQTPVAGLPAVQVATSAFEVMMTGFVDVPWTMIWASRETARLPPGSLATTVPAWMVSVAMFLT